MLIQSHIPTLPGMPKIADFVAKHHKVAFDSNILIGLFEDTDYSKQARQFFDAVQQSHAELWTSAMTIPEVLTKPMRHGTTELVRTYEVALFESTLSFAPVSARTAHRAAQLGATQKLEIRDALHLASLLDADVKGFVTADQDFKAVTDLGVYIISSTRRQRHR